MNRFLNNLFERDEDGKVPLRTMLLIGAIFSIIISLLLGNISAFIFLFIIWTGGVILSRSMDAAGAQIEEEAHFVIDRNMSGKPNAPYPTTIDTATITEATTEIDQELINLINDAVSQEDFNKIEREVSEYDAPFKMTRENIFHYLRKGKQKM